MCNFKIYNVCQTEGESSVCVITLFKGLKFDIQTLRALVIRLCVCSPTHTRVWWVNEQEEKGNDDKALKDREYLQSRALKASITGLS